MKQITELPELDRDAVNAATDFRLVRDASSGNDSKTPAGSAGGYNVGTGGAEIPTNDDLGSAAYADTGVAAGQVPKNSDLGTAAYADTGPGAGQVPKNSDLGTAAYVDTGAAANQVPTNAALGSAAYVNVGTGMAEVPTNADLVGLPPVTTDNALVRFEGVDGQTVQNSGWTLSDTDEMDANGGSLQGVELRDYSESRSAPSISGGSLTLNLSVANVFEVVLTANVSTLTLSNPPASGNVGSATLILKQDGTGGRTFAWPASAKFAGGDEPVVSADANAVDVYTLLTTDAGATWLVFVGGQAFS